MRRPISFKDYFPGVCLVWVIACSEPSKPLRFEAVSPEQTGITFSNTLEESEAFNILTYLYYYNGGGIAAGDINNDGLTDLYFSANEKGNHLYLNKGNWVFEDISQSAGVEGPEGWTTGVSMADVNGDGWLDLYVCQLGDYGGITGRNQLYINQGEGNFAEKAGAYGLDFQGFATQAAFFDYDLDGDLDMYLLTHSVHANDTYRDTSIRRDFHPTAGDRLFRNEGKRNPDDEDVYFTDVTATSGIFSSKLGYGLGIAIADLDKNGYPDVYIGNDFHENDYLYLNQGDGTFREALAESVGHTSQFSMGVDIADFNRDGWMDIISLDMKPWKERILKTAEPPNTYEIYQYKLRQGYYYQFPRNVFQVHQGLKKDTSGRLIPHFSEQGYLLGVDATDWSWSALWADLDLNGWEDLFVTNGIFRRPNDMDYINFVSQPEVVRSLEAGITEENMKFIQEMPQVKVPNRVFAQQDQGMLVQSADIWGLAEAGFSNGAVYADLDKDGDLDLVTNNLNATASLYKNHSDSLGSGNFLSIRLKGNTLNTWGVGATVTAYANENQWSRSLFPPKGYLSSMPPVVHIGVGEVEALDSVKVWWPGKVPSTTLLTEVAANQHLIIEQSNSRSLHDSSMAYLPATPQVHQWEEAVNGLAYAHQENSYVDFNKEILMPHMLSKEGPALATGDVNGDGLEDVFIGGAKNQLGSLYFQDTTGDFHQTYQPGFDEDSLHEDVDATFFDADGDLDLDLYVVSGGNEYRGPYKPLLDRLYINDGKGAFQRAEAHLPEMYVNGACVEPADIDRDGDLDLFVGGRSIAGFYGVIPRSFILENDGAGKFRDVTQEVAPDLAYAGMVSDALWVDINSDEKLDLLVAGTWMPIRSFISKKGKLQETTQLAGLGWTNGWWNVLYAADLDGDGDKDILAGNLGKNSPFTASREAPCTLYIKDFDGNGSVDPIMCRYREGKSYPVASRDELLSQLVGLKKRFLDYDSYAEAQITDIFTTEELKGAERRYVFEFSSLMLTNNGNGTFAISELPREVQVAPVYAFATQDVNQDQQPDILWGGNFFGVGPGQGRYDAGVGGIAIGTGNGAFRPVLPVDSGFWIPGEVRKMVWIGRGENSRRLLIAKNNGRTQMLSLHP